jgi:His-Xaa-Ser system protein HxsD
MHRTPRTIPADSSPAVPEILIEFDRAIQNIGPLMEAAYRLIGAASCVLETDGDRYVCRLTPNTGGPAQDAEQDKLRQRFVDLVTDENLREKVSAETAGIRDVILALAFGALAGQAGGAPGT